MPRRRMQFGKALWQTGRGAATRGRASSCMVWASLRQAGTCKWLRFTNACNPRIEFDFPRLDSYLAFLTKLRKPMPEAVTFTRMYLKCAHPDCSSDFDYAQGRLFRFQQTPSQEQQPAHWHAVKHYWLCARCCETYTIEYHRGMGVLLLERLEKLAGERPGYCVLQPESISKAASPRRIARPKARQTKKAGQLGAASLSVMEVLEARNLRGAKWQE